MNAPVQDNRIQSKLLIVDHAGKTQDNLESILDSRSYKTSTASNTSEALGIIDDTFDMVLIDSTIPEPTETEIVEQIRKNESLRNLPIILLTDRNLDNDRIARIYSLGINDFLEKPFLRQELLSRISLHIKIKKLVTELSRLNTELSKELDRSNKIYNVMMDYASIIENELVEKIDHLKADHNTTKINETVKELKSQLSQVKKNQEELLLENEHYREELDKLTKIHSVVVLHDNAIEEDMSTKIDEESRKASLDQLTQIYNRIRFYEALYSDIEKYKSDQYPLSLIMFDIDHFKSINDAFGHDMGDVVLLSISKIVKTNLSDDALFARWGGEEFMILLSSKNLHEAKAVAEQIRSKIEHNDYKKIKNVTCSFGVTQFVESDDASSLLKRVDDALYKAKRNGRNRVEAA